MNVPYLDVFRAVPGLVLLLSRDWVILDGTDAYFSATLTRRENVVGRPMFEVFPDDPEDPTASGTANLRESLETVLRTRRPHEMRVQRYPIRRPEGGFEERFWSPVNSPVLDPSGAVQFILHRVEDVTEIVRLRNSGDEQRGVIADQVALARENAALVAAATRSRLEAEEERARMHRLFLEAPAAIAALRGPDHVYELANPRYCQLIGRSAAELLGKPGREALPELVAQGIWDRFDEVLRTGEAFNAREFAARVRRRDGELDQGYFDFTLQPRRGTDGSVEGILLFAVEVTAQVLARQAVEAILQRVPVPIVLLEPQTARMLFSNRAADELWGSAFPLAESATDYGQFEVLDPTGRRLRPEEMPAVRAAKGEALAGVDVDVVSPRGRKSLLVESAAVPPLPGHPGVVVVSFQDVTRLREAVRAREEFLSIASHELNTPLTPLKLQLASLAAQEKSESGRSRLRLAEKQVDRLTHLIADLLEVSRLTAGRLPLRPEPVEVPALLREVISRLGEGSGRVQLDAGARVVAFVDPLRLDQVATNLLTNALKYGQGKPVAVRAWERDHEVVLEVRDDGIGIAPEAHEKIFERFERVAPVSHYGGFGLGLWIVRQIVEGSGGKVEVRSRPGAGATFTVTLPRPPGAAQAVAE